MFGAYILYSLRCQSPIWYAYLYNGAAEYHLQFLGHCDLDLRLKFQENRVWRILQMVYQIMHLYTKKAFANQLSNLAPVLIKDNLKSQFNCLQHQLV